MEIMVQGDMTKRKFPREECCPPVFQKLPVAQSTHGPSKGWFCGLSHTRDCRLGNNLGIRLGNIVCANSTFLRC